MSQDKELEIQLQFLEEAQEYLDTIESVVLGLAGTHIDSHKMDAVLRAAHSVKGGAGMMGFGTLSQLAHRLEDSFKVLKAQRNVIVVDESLESLLLSGVDRLRQVLQRNRQGSDVDQQWLKSVGNPVFEKLHERLGDPVADDATTMLGSDDGTNVAAMLFETEVEGCLARLESVLADPRAPCLEEELSIMAQELGGLGEMLQLGAFTQLCESILEHLEAASSEGIREIAQLALSSWRRSQALVLVGQVSSLPTSIGSIGVEVCRRDVFTEPMTQPVTLLGWDEAVQENAKEEVFAAEFDFEVTLESPTLPEVIEEELLEERVAVPQKSASVSVEVQTDLREVANSDFQWPEVKVDVTSSTRATESQENTVRIPVRQLDRLNDLFGELTIERNGLGLHLGRLRNLIETLSRRVRTLEQSNVRLRTAYDTVATQTAFPVIEKALMATSARSAPLYGRRASYKAYLDGFNNSDRAISAHPQASRSFAASSSRGESRFLDPGDNTLSISMSRFDALEMDRYSDLHLLSMEVMETIVQIQEVTSDIGLSLEDTDSTTRELNQTAKQLQTNLTRIRMRPLSDLVGRFSRALRDLSLQYGKLVELKVLGKGTLIDRSILEALSDPLMHLIRNAFDHGIENPATRQAQGKPAQAVIEIKAAHRGNQTIITVSDDGNGINLNKIRARAEAMGLDAGLLAAASEDELLSLIFEPGFSTADQVTALSGRGVGMDVVRNNLTSIRGDIRVDTSSGRGTTFTLTVPFTLSVARVLLVESNNMLLAFPTDVIEEMLLLCTEEVLTTPGSEILKWQGEMVPLTRLSTWLTFYCPRRVTTPEGVPSISEPTVLMISQGDQLAALQVDRCWGEREVAIRKVEGTLAMPPGFASCTILGDGKVVPLVDANALLRWIASCAHPDRDQDEPQGSLPLLSTIFKDNPPVGAVSISQKDTILVVDDSINVRRFLALALEKAGYLVEQAKDGQDAVEKLLGGLQVQAVICDIEMPRLDGYGFLARVKSDPAFNKLPIAMLTSRSGEKHRQLAMTLGAAAYFSKPYNERELLQTIRQLITSVASYSPRPA